jgi:hypothetical protein
LQERTSQPTALLLQVGKVTFNVSYAEVEIHKLFTLGGVSEH